MHLCTTTVRVFAIVGLGSMIGVGHALVIKNPVGFRRAPAPQIDDQTIDPTTDQTVDPMPVVHTPEVAIADPGGPSNDEQNADAGSFPIDPLDIPGPPGTLTLREAYALYDEGAYFVDARHEDEFNESHIATALFLPAPRVRSKAGLDELSMIPPEVTIVIYCVGGDCDASENAKFAIERSGLGFTDVRIMGRGFEHWVDAGLPVEHADGSVTGDQP